jgi:dTDP-4-dehydrorhamnose 3,5-epimerase
MTMHGAKADVGDPVDVEGSLPAGVARRSLLARPDDRGTLTEVFRHEWGTGIEPLQWNLVDNEARVLRGVHVHVRHHDYLMVVSGLATIALRDLRRNAPTYGLVSLVPMSGADRTALTIPPGVAHGFYFPVRGIHLYAVDSYWDPDDELGCHWLDPDLQIDWPDREALVSPRDTDAPGLAELMVLLEPFQDALYPPV